MCGYRTLTFFFHRNKTSGSHSIEEKCWRSIHYRRLWLQKDGVSCSTYRVQKIFYFLFCLINSNCISIPFSDFFFKFWWVPLNLQVFPQNAVKSVSCNFCKIFLWDHNLLKLPSSFPFLIPCVNLLKKYSLSFSV